MSTTRHHLIKQMNRESRELGLSPLQRQREIQALKKDIEDYSFTLITQLENFDIEEVVFAEIFFLKELRDKLRAGSKALTHFDNALKRSIKNAQSKNIT